MFAHFHCGEKWRSRRIASIIPVKAETAFFGNLQHPIDLGDLEKFQVLFLISHSQVNPSNLIYINIIGEDVLFIGAHYVLLAVNRGHRTPLVLQGFGHPL